MRHSVILPAVMLVVFTVVPVRVDAQVRSRLEGHVTDSLHARPLASAIILATPFARDTAFHSTQADSLGHFTFENLEPGRYRLSVEHPSIDSSGIGARDINVDLPSNGSVTTELAIPSERTLRTTVCGEALRDSTVGVMIGAVRRADDSPVANATVVFSWQDFEVDRRTATVRSRRINSSVTANASGVYRACGLPMARSIFMQAQAGSTAQSGVVEEQIVGSGILIRDLHVARIGTPASTDSAAAPTYTLSGHVLTVGGAPISSAQVALLGSGKTTNTNEAGEFRFSEIGAGTHGLEVLALGYYPRRLRAELNADARSFTVTMERSAVVLDSLRIIAKQTFRPPGRTYSREFDLRAAAGVGYFLNEAEIADKHAVTTSDIFKNVPGIRIIASPKQHDVVYVTSTRGSASFVDEACALDIFVDGIKARTDEINIVRPADLHGVEVHTVSTAPAKYQVGKCGAVFLWTRIPPPR